jgi:7-cyano-7-deazaguanine synthase
MKTVLLFSGGIDSTTVLYHLLKQTDKTVYPIHFFYGQKSGANEIVAIHETIDDLSLSKRLKLIKIVDISQSQIFKSSLTTPEIKVPQGDIDISRMEEADITFVPFRNVIMISMACAYAYSVDASEIYTGTFNLGYSKEGFVHADASPDIERKIADIVDRVSNHRLKLVSPFVNIYKQEIFKWAKDLKVPFDKTWSCYAGGKIQCGICGSCSQRRKGLELEGIVDKTKYAN